MEEATLQAVKRAMPGHGRARIHEKLLSVLGIEDQEEVEVISDAGKTLTLNVFSDDMVDEGTIRVSENDLQKLGIPDGGKVVVRRKIPLEEQVVTAAEAAAEQIKAGAKEVGGKISDAAGKFEAKAKEVSDKLVQDAKPVSDKVSKAVKDSAKTIKEKIPLGKMAPEIEKALANLPPDDAKKIRAALTGVDGDQAAITVSSASGRSIDNLTVPPEASIVSIQRNDSILEVKPDTMLKAGDIVYVTGKQTAVQFIKRMLEE